MSSVHLALFWLFWLMAAASSLAASTPSDRPALIVWDFAARDGSRSNVTESLTLYFEEALASSGRYSILERRKFPRLKAVIDNERALGQLGDISPSSQTTLKGLGAELVAFGDTRDDLDAGVYEVHVAIHSLQGVRIAGSSINIPRGKIADSDTRKQAMAALVQALADENKSVDQPDSAGVPFFVERFDDNSHRWYVSDDLRAPAEIRQGTYYFSSPAGEWRFATIPVTLPANDDFRISCKVIKLRGDDRAFFGLLWGAQDSNNFFNFAITGGGQVAVTLKSNGNFHDFMNNLRPHEEVHRGQASNLLAIVRRGGRMLFYVNGKEMHAMDWPWPMVFNPNVGFLAYGELQLAIDELTIALISR